MPPSSNSRPVASTPEHNRDTVRIKRTRDLIREINTKLQKILSANVDQPFSDVSGIREQVEALSEYLGELGLAADAKRLTKSYRNFFNAFWDTLLCDQAKEQPADVQDLLRRFGQFPLPDADETINAELQRDRRVAVIGHAALIVQFLETLGNSLEREELERSDKPSEGNVASERKSRTRKERQYEWQAKALLLLKEDPGRTNQEIARLLEISPGQLSRFKEFREARQSYARQPAGGFVKAHADGSDVEAVAAPQGQFVRGEPIPGSRFYHELCSECGEQIRVTSDQVGNNPLCEACA